MKSFPLNFKELIFKLAESIPLLAGLLSSLNTMLLFSKSQVINYKLPGIICLCSYFFIDLFFFHLYSLLRFA